MTTNLRIFLIGMLLTCSLLACTDHRLRPLSPSNLRLRTTNNINSPSSPFSTEYNYGPNNRVTSFTTSLGTRGVFTYGERDQYRQFDYFYQLTDESRGERTRFQYSQDEKTLTVSSNFFQNGNHGSTFQTTTYELDADRRLLSSYTGDGPTSVASTYRYTGGNITNQRTVAGRTVNSVGYEYDDKPNPYYGLIAPDIGEIRRFGRNNIIKITNGTAITEYVYEYNAQGLPTKASRKGGSEEVRFTYESY